jgi:hypothetical protein
MALYINKYKVILPIIITYKIAKDLKTNDSHTTVYYHFKTNTL